MRHPEYKPTPQQIQNGIDILNQSGIVFEGNSTFIHNRTPEYINALRLAGYEGNIFGIAEEVLDLGYMYCVYDSNLIDSYKQAQNLIIKHFTK